MTDFDDLGDLLTQPIDVGKINKPQNNASQQQQGGQDFLTADLFSNMTDDEILSHFMPIRGIDFDQNYINDDQQPLKKEKDEDQPIMYMADEFLPYRMMPQMNPVYHLNQELFKSVVPTNRAKEPIHPLPKEVEMKPVEIITDHSRLEHVVHLDHQSMSGDSSDELDVIGIPNSPNNLLKQVELQQQQQQVASMVESVSPVIPAPSKKEAQKKEEDKKQTPRPIMKRKPRTYKYNPKPLQEKVNRAFVPDDLKDVEYWERRKRNNEAAKKSRKERREKELEIMNNYENIRKEFEQIKEENAQLKERNADLEKKLKEMKEKQRV